MSKSKKNDSMSLRRRLFRHKDGKVSAVKVMLMILAIPVFVVVAVITVAFIYIPFQKPNFVNKNLEFSNKLAVPEQLKPRIVNGEKVFDLTAQEGKTEFLEGKRTKTWGYNGTYLGPTIRARAGDKVRISVTNNLDDSTTTHWHGMHLPAAMDGAVHQFVKPGEKWQPNWTIANEAAPLWYHPHFMDKTGEQVYKGLAGMFIIEDRNSDSLDIPKAYGVDDIPLIVQDREFDKEGQFVYEPERGDVFGHSGMHGDKILVNGTYAPYVKVPAKHVRLRILNGSNARRYDFGFADGRTFYQIATDGGFLESPVARTRMTLAPAERAEIVLDLFGTTRPLTLMSYALYEENTVLRFMKNLLGANRDENQEFKILELRPQATDAQPKPLPQKLNSIDELDPDSAVKTRRFELGGEARKINGKKMDHMRIDEIVRTGDTEIWEISDQTATFHPFHIHGVQFLILSRNGKPPADYERGWKDTVLVHGAETVRVIMRMPEFADSHTPFMYHCHILEHEDMGMMGQFMVVGKDTKNEDIFIKSRLTETQQEMRH